MTKGGRMKEVPNVFNWVKARSECSLQRLFDDLIKVVKSDIQSFNEYSEHKGWSRRVKFNQVCVRQFDVEVKLVVVGQSKDKSFACLMVSLNGSSIEFFRGSIDNMIFSARPFLLDTGECLLEVDDKPYRLWQVSQKAFEDLFFGGLTQ